MGHSLLRIVLRLQCRQLFPCNTAVRHNAQENTDMTKLAATINEAVEISGLSRSALYRAVGEGKLTLRKNGKRSLILVSELQAFLQSLPAAA
jgi:hypothetical protein